MNSRNIIFTMKAVHLPWQQRTRGSEMWGGARTNGSLQRWGRAPERARRVAQPRRQRRSLVHEAERRVVKVRRREDDDVAGGDEQAAQHHHNQQRDAADAARAEVTCGLQCGACVQLHASPIATAPSTSHTLTALLVPSSAPSSDK
jgi:hypothetical protein